jgi:hypothetical protein
MVGCDGDDASPDRDYFVALFLGMTRDVALPASIKASDILEESQQ